MKKRNTLSVQRSLNQGLHYLKMLVVVLVVFIFNPVFSQETEDVLEYAHERMFFQPEESIQIGERYLQRAELSSEQQCEARMMLAQAYLLLEKFDQAVENIFLIQEAACKLNSQENFDFLLIQNDVFQRLELLERQQQTEQQIKDLLSLVQADKKLQQKWKVSKNYRNLKETLIRKEVPQHIEIPAVDELIFKQDLQLLGQYTFLQAWEAMQKHEDFDFKLVFLEKSLLPESDFEEMYYRYFALPDAQRLNLSAESDQAIELLNITLEKIKEVEGLTFYKQNIYRLLTEIFVDYKEKDQVSQYFGLENQFSAKSDVIFTNAITNVFSHKAQMNIQQLSEHQKGFKVYRNILWITGSGILLFLLIYYLRFTWQEKYFKEIAAYMEQIKPTPSVPKKVPVVEELVPKKSTLKVSQDAEEQILSGLEEFEKQKSFLQKDISLAYVASELKMNTKYLSEVLNSRLNENFNGYINRLRIEYIVNKLKNEPEYLKYKISYLAEIAGYASHSSFTTAFKSITGMPPTTFINYLKKKV